MLCRTLRRRCRLMVATQWATLRAFPVEELEGESLPEALFHRADSHHLVSPRPPSVVDASRSACCCSPPEIDLPESCLTALAKAGTRNLLLWTGCDDFVRFGGRLSGVLGWKCHRKDTCKRPVKNANWVRRILAHSAQRHPCAGRRSATPSHQPDPSTPTMSPPLSGFALRPTQPLVRVRWR